MSVDARQDHPFWDRDPLVLVIDGMHFFEPPKELVRAMS